MKCFLLLGAVLSLPFLPTQAQAPEGGTVPVAFVGVHVVPMDEERVLEDQTVIVQGDRIVSMGPVASTVVPPGAERIEGEGRYLMPGLAEMHGHVPPPSAPAAFTEDVLFLYVANGITTVRGMLGAPGQLELRARANTGAIVAPTLYLAGPSFNGNSVHAPEQATEMVHAQKAEGWDLLKVHPGLTRDEYDAMAQAAHEVGIAFGGHVPTEVGLLHALEMRQETFDHVDGYVEYLEAIDRPVDEAELAEVVRLTREAGAWIVPTMALWEVLYGTLDLETLSAYPELKYMPAGMVAQWKTIHAGRLGSAEFNPTISQQVIANRMRILEALHDGGVPILMGTDAPQQFSVPGFSLHRELERMEAAGLSPYEVLRTGTYNVGRYFAAQDTFGTVAPGNRADLILVDANPLRSLATVATPGGVMVRGRWLPRDAIQARLDEIAVE